MQRSGRLSHRAGLALSLLVAASLAACATPRLSTKPGSLSDNSPPRGAGKPSGRLAPTMRPYRVGGTWYTPRDQPNYNETGMASWYGQQFHNRQTANGEMFDQWVISAAHKTLPLPSIVEVTNLDNGRKIKVRVNDRGPFVSDRIIDLSRAGADALGFSGKGTARVRVRYVGPAPGRGEDRTLRYAGVQKDPTPTPREPDRGFFGLGGDRDWSVQAGAFANRDNAEKAVNSLRDVGKARIIPVRRDGGTLYRVVVAGKGGSDDAARARDTVATMGFPDAKLVSSN
jgi:rare lipoprotein A